MILNALHGDSLPVYGDGMQVRNWIHSTDFARAIGHVLEHGAPGEVYNAGGPDEQANIAVVKRIVELTGAEESQIEHVADRPGHDRRYSLSSEKVRALGWTPACASATASSRRSRGTARTLVVGADPLGRLSRVLRAPVRAFAGVIGARVSMTGGRRGAGQPLLEIFHLPASFTSESVPRPGLAAVDALHPRGRRAGSR